LPEKRIAYFSMEIGLEAKIPTYSGGLGILAGDTIRSAADHNIPLVAVTLLHRKGYFRQKLDASGIQKELPREWVVEDLLAELSERVSVRIEGRTVRLRCWKYEVNGVRGHHVPVYFLDSDVPENTEWDRKLSHNLYGGDERYRLAQEVILGIGGVRMLSALRYEGLERFHMNEGHSSLLTAELLRRQMLSAGRKSLSEGGVEAVRDRCVFTTHTPVAAGHDRFPPELAKKLLDEDAYALIEPFCLMDGKFNLTYLALNLSRYVNGVARKHTEVSRLMFGGYTIDSITNGVHASTWTSEPLQDLFDKHIPGWREDNSSLRYASSISGEEIWAAHQENKRRLIEAINEVEKANFDTETFTIGFARRATAYKRAALLFDDVQRLQKIASRVGPIQLVYAGKAHPRDQAGKDLIKRIFDVKKKLKSKVRLVYLENYDIEMGRLLTAGVDLWLNTPQPPLEASGTSGMKAALNGVPSFSVLDGWWIEGHMEGITGWAIGENHRLAPSDGDRAKDARALYQKLEEVVLPLYYEQRKRYIEVMGYTIALNGAFFNTDRMIGEYLKKAYS
jgi:starch phosphorylase